MAKYIVFDGVDCSGKTTLLRYIINQLETKAVPDHYPRRKIATYDSPEELLQEMSEHRYVNGIHFIDRYWMSTLVYQRVNWTAGQMLERLPIDCFVWCDIDQRAWLERIKNRGDEWFDSPDKIMEFQDYRNRYQSVTHDLQENTSLPTFTIHTDAQGVPNTTQVNEVIEHIKTLL